MDYRRTGTTREQLEQARKRAADQRVELSSFPPPIINTSKFGIGFQDTTLGPFGGLIYEGFILTSVASAAMRVRAERYLKSKWGTA